jgi:ligand-binding SRPBCC domain-containing protein
MKVFHLRRIQQLPVTLEEAWAFFSSPRNLAAITPTHMKFKILHITGDDKMYEGQMISYKIGVLPFYQASWVTEITHVRSPHFFVDEQRHGPFALWHHEHRFEKINGGVEMTDEVTYALPLGPLGLLAHPLFVKRELNRIFEYRFQALEKLFPQPEVSIFKIS